MYEQAVIEPSSPEPLESSAPTVIRPSKSRFPVQVNGHTVELKHPDHPIPGSGDSNILFECTHCHEKAHPHENRSVSKATWAENYFSYIPCSASTAQRSEC